MDRTGREGKLDPVDESDSRELHNGGLYMKNKELTHVFKHITAERCTEILTGLISVDSVNPFGSHGKAESGLGRHLLDELKRIGLRVEKQPVDEERFNVVAFLEGKRSGPTIMMNSHMDTVGVQGMKDPFRPRVSDGKIYGRGSCDAKGSIASMIMALEALVKSKEMLAGNVILAAVCDEEYRSIGTDRIVEEYKADFAVVGEPTELQLGIAHKGFVWVKLTVIGKAAHGSVPEQGVDAIEKTANLISALKALRDEYMRRPPHRLLGKPKIHMGTINGGTQPSVVPDLCELVLERRSLPAETTESILKEIRTIVEDAVKKDSALKVDVSSPFQRIPFEVDRDDTFIRTFEDVFEKVLPRKAVVCGLPYWTDAAIISNKLKIPVCVLGPGDIKYAHSSDEHIRIDELVEAAKVYSALIATICS
jgi:acetylornithine deacetylase